MIRKSKYTFTCFKSNAGLGLKINESVPKKKQFLIEYHGKKITELQSRRVGGKYLFEINTKYTINGSQRKNLARYINHSCRPNCETKVVKHRIYIYSKRKINSNEELTYNYGKEYFTELIKPNKCRCIKCLEKKLII